MRATHVLSASLMMILSHALGRPSETHLPHENPPVRIEQDSRYCSNKLVEPFPHTRTRPATKTSSAPAGTASALLLFVLARLQRMSSSFGSSINHSRPSKQLQGRLTFTGDEPHARNPGSRCSSSSTAVVGDCDGLLIQMDCTAQVYSSWRACTVCVLPRRRVYGTVFIIDHSSELETTAAFIN